MSRFGVRHRTVRTRWYRRAVPSPCTAIRGHRVRPHSPRLRTGHRCQRPRMLFWAWRCRCCALRSVGLSSMSLCSQLSPSRFKAASESSRAPTVLVFPEWRVAALTTARRSSSPPTSLSSRTCSCSCVWIRTATPLHPLGTAVALAGTAWGWWSSCWQPQKPVGWWRASMTQLSLPPCPTRFPLCCSG